jgi:hypothetical protein
VRVRTTIKNRIHVLIDRRLNVLEVDAQLSGSPVLPAWPYTKSTMCSPSAITTADGGIVPLEEFEAAHS